MISPSSSLISWTDDSILSVSPRNSTISYWELHQCKISKDGYLLEYNENGQLWCIFSISLYNMAFQLGKIKLIFLV